MKFKNINFNHKSEWILWFLSEQDGYCSRNEIVDSLSSLPLTYDIVAANTRKMKSVGLVHEDEMFVANVNNKKIYKVNSDKVKEYLQVKEENELGSTLASPTDFVDDELKKLKDENEELRADLNRCESEIKTLENKIETVQNMFNSNQKRQERMTNDIDTLHEGMDTNRHYINEFIKWVNNKFGVNLKP